MFEYTADDLYAIITSQDYTIDQKLKVILDLKQYIKKFFVDLTEVNRYFESLKYALKATDSQLTLAAFGTVCHLVKRVGMQDPNALRGCSKTVLPILVNKLLDEKHNIRLQAKKSLEIYWLATPSVVESHIRDSALIHSNPRIRSEAIVFISDLIELSQNFQFVTFLPNLVNLLRDDFIEVVKNVEVLLIKYYTLNKSKLQELIAEMKSQKIERKIAVPIIKELDPILSNSYTIESKPPAAAPRTTIDTFNNLSRLKRSTTSFGTRTSKVPTPASTLSRPSMTPSIIGPANSASPSVSGSSGAYSDVQSLLDSIPTTHSDPSLKPLVSHSASDLRRAVEALLLAFEGKETEFNWGNREKNIIKFRSLVIGNSETLGEELVQCTRLLQDGIFKAISSLRTTLSSNGCQLIKELAVNLNKSLDPLVEVLFQPLAALTSSTKKIASSNAYGSLCVLINNTSFNSRILNQCFQLYQDKNTQPRLYSSTFLQIFILKHSTRIDTLNMELIVKWLSKGVADPNTTVRESMRSTFWLFFRTFQDTAESIYQKQDGNIKKALDRAKPSDLQSSTSNQTTGVQKLSSNTVHKRPSIRDFVAAKQKEKRMNTGLSNSQSSQSRQFESAYARAISPEPSFKDQGRSARLAMAQRPTGIRASSAGSLMNSNPEPFPQKLSRGNLRAEIGSAQVASGNVGTRVSSLPDERRLASVGKEEETAIEKMIRLLQSSLTKDRIEGLDALKFLMSQNLEIPDLSDPIQNLIILDSTMIKPFISEPKFFGLVSLDLALKILATSRVGLDVLTSKYTLIEIAEALLNLITVLDNIRFDTAPSTMFHIKHKAVLLNFCISSLYRISENPSFRPSDDLFGAMCKTVFPLSITDYPYYDELIAQLQCSNSQSFDKILSGSSNFIQGSIKSIISSFKDEVNKTAQSGAEENNRLNEMTMINPLAKLATDPTLSLQAGFRTDMTMVVPSYLQPNKETVKETNEVPKVEDKMEVDQEEKKRFDYISDIFQATSPSTKSPATNVDQPNLDEELKSPTESDINDGLINSPHVEYNRDNTPFIDKTPDVTADDGTSSITHQISDIYISPEKRPIEMSLSTDRQIGSFSVGQDPFITKPSRKISIFDRVEDVDEDIDVLTQKMVDLLFNKIGRLDKSLIISSSDVVALLERFENDCVTARDLENMMVYLYYCSKSIELKDWMGSEGFLLVLDTLTRYFMTSGNIARDTCFKGLMIFNELLELHKDLSYLMSLKQAMGLLDVVFMIIENLKDTKNEIYITVEEIMENLLDSDINGLMDGTIEKCTQSLHECEHTIMTVFLLLTLSKAISRTELLMTEQIQSIDNVLRCLLSDKEVEVRKLTVQAYAKIMRNLKVLNEGKDVLSEDDIVMQKTRDTLNGVFSKLSQPSRRLITHYCDNSV
ncbi:hypothetical protein WICPIJ_005920 [Wickerhamomyces pijperi]|uniref:Protein STU1 n=1 Tax=Wickerhamomyces pijperi TaxID=599730 RepID=A0A9P8Q4Z5_WICPI|nr:hypothetical protein WICPIJ_005920 [Wickerhamomyces pijperi]